MKTTQPKIITLPAHQAVTLSRPETKEGGGWFNIIDKKIPAYIKVEASEEKYFTPLSLEEYPRKDFSSKELFASNKERFYGYSMLDFYNVYDIISLLFKDRISGIDISYRNFVYLHLFAQVEGALMHIAIMKDYMKFMQIEYSSSTQLERNWIGAGGYLLLPTTPPPTPSFSAKTPLNLNLFN